MMADVLKNNLLEGLALSLVRSVTDIDEIWKRLRRSLGDPKSLVKKKLFHLGKKNQIWKLKDSEKMLEALSKMINFMKDLEHLAYEHNIQARLYSGDGINRIYQLLGDNRVTRWLSTICDDTYNDQELWSKLTEILEKSWEFNNRSFYYKRKAMRKDSDHILKKRGNIVDAVHTLRMQPNQIQNVISVMKMKTI